MIPTTGSISLDDINSEFGYSTGTLQTWASIISLMRTWDGSSPISMLEWRGYDVDWEGWTSAESPVYTVNPPPANSELKITVRNNSRYASMSGTVYYRFVYLGSAVQSGSMTFTGLAINSTVNVYDYFLSGFPYDTIEARFDASADWQVIG